MSDFKRGLDFNRALDFETRLERCRAMMEMAALMRVGNIGAANSTITNAMYVIANCRVNCVILE